MTRTAWITGAHGFIGRHLARECRARGWSVAGVGHGAWDEGEAERWGVSRWVRGEVAHETLDLLAADAPRPDFIFHLAGGSSVGLSVAAPDEDFRRSVTSTAEVLRWMTRTSPESVLVLASSAAVYGAAGPMGIPESLPCVPCSPYGQHKRIAEMLGVSFARRRGARVAIVRLFSVYGPHLRKQLFWDLCTRLTRSPAEVLLSGTGEETRDFLHVEDAARLLADRATRAGAEGAPGLIVNGGTGVATSVREVAERVIAAWDRSTPVRFTGRSRPGDPATLVADTRVARDSGWTPRTPLAEGVAGYVSWFRGATVPVAP
jgi:UDP-glucose 4-epimerase